MKKRFLAVFLAIMVGVTSFSVLTGCQARPFTVTFLPGAELNIEDAEDATILDVKDKIEDSKLYIDGDYVQTVTNVSQLKPPKFARKGYVHQGWNKLLSNIKGNATVQAHWVQRSFEVIFEPGALDATYYLSQGTDIRVKQVVGSGVELEPPMFERPGYTVSWDYRAISFIEDACTVTPQWIPNDYTLTFSDGFDNQYESITATYGKQIKDGLGQIPEPVAHPQGKGFGGWRYLEDTDDGSEVANEIIFITEDSEWVYPTDATLHALWLERGQYRLIYNDAYNHANKLLYSETDETFSLFEPTRKGYTFAGWTYEGQTVPQKNVEIESGSTGDKEFTANWIANEYKLILDAGNFGDCGDGYQKKIKTVTYGELVTDLPSPVRDGYVFVCWISENGTVIENDKIWKYDSGASLSAVYKRIYTIKFDLECTITVKDGDRTKNVVVVCSLPNDYINKYKLKPSVNEDNMYVMEGYIEGTRLPELPKATPIDTEEFAFSSWRYNKVKKVAGTILSESNFPNSIEIGIITLKVACYTLWTDFL